MCAQTRVAVVVAACLSSAALVCCRNEGPTGDVPPPPAAPAAVGEEPARAGSPSSGAGDVVGDEEPNQVRISGEAFLRERIALPGDARLVVRLVQLEAGGPAGAEVMRVEAPAGRQGPIPFELFVPREQLQPGAAYGLAATIARRGVSAFATDAPVPVLAPGSPATGLRLLLRRVP